VSLFIQKIHARKTRANHDKRRFFSDARATLSPIFGVMINSSTVTFERPTRYSSTSRVDSGGLKFHCCRAISWSELSPFGDHRNTNSCVRGSFIRSGSPGSAWPKFDTESGTIICLGHTVEQRSNIYSMRNGTLLRVLARCAESHFPEEVTDMRHD